MGPHKSDNFYGKVSPEAREQEVEMLGAAGMDSEPDFDNA